MSEVIVILAFLLVFGIVSLVVAAFMAMWQPHRGRKWRKSRYPVKPPEEKS